MKRPLAYITYAWNGKDPENVERAIQHCRSVYVAGFSPVCPTLFRSLYLNDPVPEEHKDGIDMARDLFKRARAEPSDRRKTLRPAGYEGDRRRQRERRLPHKMKMLIYIA